MTDPTAPVIAPPFMRVSNSEIQTFKECRRKWWLSYYRQLKPRNKQLVGPLALGTRVHKALEYHYKDGYNLLDAYSGLMETDRFNAVESGLFDLDKLDQEGELGRLMLEGYLEWVAEEGLDANLEVIGVEEILTMPITLLVDDVPVTVDVIGKLDLRVKDRFTGQRSILDFKTTMQFANFEATSHMAEQLKTYMALDYVTHASDPDNRIGGAKYRMLRKVKRGPRAVPPFYREITVNHNQLALRGFMKGLRGVLKDMVRTKRMLDDGAEHFQVVYPRVSADCTWKCPFFTACSMFDDGSGAEDLLDEVFEPGDPYDYYEEHTHSA